MRAFSASRVQGHDISWPYKLVIPSAARNLLFHVVNKFVRETYMPSRYWIHLAELAIAILLALAIYCSWRADRRDRAQLQSELAATKQLLASADARQHERDAALRIARGGSAWGRIGRAAKWFFIGAVAGALAAKAAH